MPTVRLRVNIGLDDKRRYGIVDSGANGSEVDVKESAADEMVGRGLAVLVEKKAVEMKAVPPADEITSDSSKDEGASEDQPRRRGKRHRNA